LKLVLTEQHNTALEQALRILGYNNVYSMDRLATDQAADCETWLRALKAKHGNGKEKFGKQDWSQLIGGFDVSDALIPALLDTAQRVSKY
jgi:hypothetical protein